VTSRPLTACSRRPSPAFRSSAVSRSATARPDVTSAGAALEAEGRSPAVRTGIGEFAAIGGPLNRPTWTGRVSSGLPPQRDRGRRGGTTGGSGAAATQTHPNGQFRFDSSDQGIRWKTSFSHRPLLGVTVNCPRAFWYRPVPLVTATLKLSPALALSGTRPETVICPPGRLQAPWQRRLLCATTTTQLMKLRPTRWPCWYSASLNWNGSPAFSLRRGLVSVKWKDVPLA
jgi:hypothetical protein